MTTTMMKTDTSEVSDGTAAQAGGPMILDLGKHPKKRVKSLLRGQGRLLQEVRDCIAELKRAQKIAPSAEVVVVVVRQKSEDTGLKLPRF